MFSPIRRLPFLASLLTITALGPLRALAVAEEPAPPALFARVGVAAPIDKAPDLASAGIEFLTENTNRFLVPDKPEAVFEANLAKLSRSPLPVLACNGFIRPKHLRCVGAEANHEAVLAWAETCFRRLAKAGGKFIVFGSAGSRQLREGWPKEKADRQFVALLQRMGPLAEQHGVIVALEQLQTRECNYINHLAEGAAIVRAVDHPHVRLLADLYHMACMGDTPEDLAAAMDVIVHVEIAEKEKRTAPGVKGDDFRPYFRVLQDHGYKGAISIEGRWQMQDIAPAVAEIAQQVANLDP